MTKADLKTGMTVQTRIGDWLLVYDGKLVDHDGYLDLADYADDLEDCTADSTDMMADGRPKYGVVKVCAPSNMAWTIDDILVYHGEVLWERE